MRVLVKHGTKLVGTTERGCAKPCMHEHIELGAEVNDRVMSSCFYPGHDFMAILIQAGWNGKVFDGATYGMIIADLVAHDARLEDGDSRG